MAVASARALPYRDGAFSGLWSMSTLMHVPSTAIDGAMREVARILAPGAVAAIGVWAGPDQEGFADDGRPGARRLFSSRPEGRWRELFGHIGPIEDYEVWDGDDSADEHTLRYHLAFVTRTPTA